MTEQTPAPGVFGTDRVTDFAADGTAYSVSVDWLALGCPDRFCVALGDRVVDVAVPHGFPREPIAHVEKDLDVYERKQSFTLSSTRGGNARHVRLTLETAGLDVPLTLLCQDGPLLDGDPPLGGPIQSWKPGGVLSNPDGSVKWYIYWRILRGLEKDVAGGAACRPEGRSYSILSSRWESPKRLVHTDLEPDGDFVLVTEHYAWTVLKTWVVYICRNGAWARSHGVQDEVTRTTKIRYRAV